MNIFASGFRLVAAGLIFMASSAHSATSYQVTNSNVSPANGWITGIPLEALFLIDQSSAINDPSDLNSLLGSPATVGTVSVSGTNPTGPLTASFANSGGTNFSGFTSLTKTDTTDPKPISGTYTLPAGTSYFGLKDGTGGILVGVFENQIASATDVSFLMTWTSLVGNNVNQGLSNWFYGQNDGVLPPESVPVPAAVWLFGSALLGIVGIVRRGSLVGRA